MNVKIYKGKLSEIIEQMREDLKNEKVLVTINNLEGNNAGLKIFNILKLEGRLSAPFKAGNPSQFDYGNYLRNHNAYAVFYAKNVENTMKL